MKKIFKITLWLLLSCFISSCVSNKTVCKDPRPEICTRQYDPVCATRDTGTRCFKEPCPEATEEKTYSNACTACADESVSHFREGEC